MLNTTSTLVTVSDQQVTTTSLIISEAFCKNHRDVLRTIERLECSQEFRERNFAPSSYQSEQNKPQPCYNITRDGFTFLAMGFTGKKAAQFKEAFIAQFNKMEKILLEGAESVKRYEFRHHRATSAPGELDIKFSVSALKGLPHHSRLLALQELTGLDMTRAIAALPEVDASENRDTEIDAIDSVLSALFNGGAEEYELCCGFDGKEREYIEADPMEIGTALSGIAERLDLDGLLENRTRFFSLLRDKQLLKSIGWQREQIGFGSWQKIRYTRLGEV